MRIKKMILNVLLHIINMVTHLFPIRKNRVTFVSLESNHLEQDLLQIYEEIKDRYEIKTVLIKFHKNNLWTNFLYMLNTMKQVWYINRSSVVIINDNNYVISNFKRSGVKVIQVWHATGAVKKFGNCLPREYKIQNYDYVIANSEYWVKPFSEAFGVTESQVKVLGMPRVDKLYDETYKEKMKVQFLQKYPQCKDKKIILYAPTFRGNIYKGFSTMDLDGEALVEAMGEEYILLYKYHPLLAETKIPEHKQCINVSKESLYEVFVVSEMLISDYSSIVFDYAILGKRMLFFVPDLEEYKGNVGHFLDYQTMPGPICRTTEAIIHGVRELEYSGEYEGQVTAFQKKYFSHHDGENTKRIIELIDDVI